MKADKINKTWFKNNLKKGNLLVKCTGQYSDDYYRDYLNNYGKTGEFIEVDLEKFDDWYVKCLTLWGDKNGVINACFASCEWYEFKLKTVN